MVKCGSFFIMPCAVCTASGVPVAQSPARLTRTTPAPAASPSGEILCWGWLVCGTKGWLLWNAYRRYDFTQFHSAGAAKFASGGRVGAGSSPARSRAARKCDRDADRGKPSRSRKSRRRLPRLRGGVEGVAKDKPHYGGVGWTEKPNANSLTAIGHRGYFIE